MVARFAPKLLGAIAVRGLQLTHEMPRSRGVHWSCVWAALVSALCVVAFGLTRSAAIWASVIAGVSAGIVCEMLRRGRRSERVYSESFHASPVPLVLRELATGRAVDANDAWTQLTGWSRTEVIGTTAADLGILSDSDCAIVKRRVAGDGTVRDLLLGFRRKDGEQRESLLSAVPVELDGVEHFLATILDVTDVRRAESNAHDFEQRFRELADAIDEVFWIYDPQVTKIVYVSPAYERIWGRSCERLYERPREWLEAIHPEDRERVLATVTMPEIEYRIVRPDGTIRGIHHKTFPIRDASGTVTRMAGVATDVTERRTLEAELWQAQKMESLGRLAGGVAHDFNNILAVIAASADMLRDLTPETGESRELIDEVEHAVSRATGLTRQLLAFSRKERTEPVVLDVNAVVGETRKMLRRMIGDDVALETSLEPDLAHVRMDAGHLVQVLMNLAVNARDAMPGGGKLVIETRNYANGSRNVVLVVRDTGTGMTPDVRARIFEPFFTTKAAGKGTGMGLSVVHGIVELAHGHIDVESEPGRGTTFHIYFPAIDAPLAAAAELVRPPPSGIGTVLVVDDDPHVRTVIARALRGRGYRAIEAADGPTALALIDGEAIDLLVTDLCMPLMNGHELADAARSSRPGLKVLYTTGYADDEIAARCVGDGSALLEKPYRIDALATKVAAMLANA